MNVRVMQIRPSSYFKCLISYNIMFEYVIYSINQQIMSIILN